MKNQYFKNLMGWVSIGGVVCVGLGIIELLVVHSMISNNDKTVEAISVPIFFIMFLLYLVIVGVKFVKYCKVIKECDNKEVEETKEMLNSTFQPVILRDIGSIPKEHVKCQAKVNENGKITCKILVDFETEIEDYKTFWDNFKIDKES